MDTEPQLETATSFEELVSRDWRGQATDHERAILMLPQNVVEWADTLKNAIRAINLQLSRAKERETEILDEIRPGDNGTIHDLTDQVDRLREWRKRAAGAKFFMENRLAVAKRLVGEFNLSRSRTEDQQMRVLLRRAIQRHREAVMASEFAPTEWDVDLWGALEEWPETDEGGS